MIEEGQEKQPFAEEQVSKPEGDKSVLLEVIKSERDEAKANILNALKGYGANELCISYIRKRLDKHLNNFTYMRNYYSGYAPKDITRTSLRFGENLAKDLFANYPLFDLHPSDLRTIIIDITQIVNSAYWGSYTLKAISDKQLISETTEYRQYQDNPNKKGFIQSLFGG